MAASDHQNDSTERVLKQQLCCFGNSNIKDHQNDSTERVLKLHARCWHWHNDGRPSKRLDRASTESRLKSGVWGERKSDHQNDSTERVLKEQHHDMVEQRCWDHQNDSTERVLKEINARCDCFGQEGPSKRLDRASTESSARDVNWDVPLRPSKRLDRASTESGKYDRVFGLIGGDHQNDSTERVLKGGRAVG